MRYRTIVSRASCAPFTGMMLILLVGVFALPEVIALKAGLRKGDVRIPAGYEGSGDYMASLEVTHQLHCVVCILIFKSIWIVETLKMGWKITTTGRRYPSRKRKALNIPPCPVSEPQQIIAHASHIFTHHSTPFHPNTDSNRTSSAKPSGSTTRTTKTSATNSATRNPSSKRIYTTASKHCDKQ
jgi:hypothetical protein